MVLYMHPVTEKTKTSIIIIITSPVRVRTSILKTSSRIQAMMLMVPTTMQFAEMERSHLVFLKIFALLDSTSLPSHQFCSFNFYKNKISSYCLIIDMHYSEAVEYDHTAKCSSHVIHINIQNIFKQAPPVCQESSSWKLQSKESFHTSCDNLKQFHRN